MSQFIVRDAIWGRQITKFGVMFILYVLDQVRFKVVLVLFFFSLDLVSFLAPLRDQVITGVLRIVNMTDFLAVQPLFGMPQTG